MSTTISGRLDIFRAWPEGYRAMQELEAALRHTDLDPALLELVRTRASQINGCAFCLHMHATTAGALGESLSRLLLLNAWRETGNYYSPAERAALALTEEITRCNEGVRDETLKAAREHFPGRALAQLVYAISAINAWNRLAIADSTPPIR